ncbi:Ger(x)C family spore germination protein [Paenibacillus sp. KQZ6P-2]|uniref:Ger(X)C family spore germination protein n=1 Tax=Paenibacillus mangrovi TaxID=2931978 RepID=A0A9X1WS80_9BACL|nr:Ger(x)C family spore germination protein [Paenibacillus mangrovi]MCJ8013671.1 Ger(x)C family spore germination protein [Paenibacillus mangrovi]
MKRIFDGLLLFIIIALTTGCWDHEYLKDMNLAYSIAFDLTKDHKIKQTVELIIPPETEQSATKNEIHTATGFSTRGASNELRNRVRGNMRVIKNGVQLIGKSLAINGLDAPMDVNFRDPKNPTSNVRMLIADKEAGDIVNQKKIGELKIGEFLTSKITSLENMSLFYPPETMDTVFHSLKDPGQDFALPLIGMEGDEVAAKGVALFHDQYYSGMLDTEQSILLVLLKGKTGGNARFTKTIDIGSTDSSRSELSYNVGKKKIKRTFKVNVANNGDVHVTLNIKLRAILEEYTGTHLLDDKAIARLNQELSSMMTSDAKDVIRELQKAKCDIFGVGRKLIAYHNPIWKQKNWKEDYQKVHFHTNVQVSIIDTGITQ